MLALRYAGMVALAVWVGGLLALGANAAPSVFEVIALRNVADGRVLAGLIVGEVFGRFHIVTYGCGVVILASLAARALLGPRPRRFAVRMAIASLMLAASLYSGLVVSRAIERLQQEIGASPSSLPEHDPRRAAFGRLHTQSSTIQLVPLLGGLVLMFWELKD